MSMNFLSNKFTLYLKHIYMEKSIGNAVAIMLPEKLVKDKMSHGVAVYKKIIKKYIEWILIDFIIDIGIY